MQRYGVFFVRNVLVTKFSFAEVSIVTQYEAFFNILDLFLLGLCG